MRAGGGLGRRMVDRASGSAGRRRGSVTSTWHAGRRDLLRRTPGNGSKIRVGVLVGHEPAADLGVGVGRDDRLGPVALEAAPDAR